MVVRFGYCHSDLVQCKEEIDVAGVASFGMLPFHKMEVVAEWLMPEVMW